MKQATTETRFYVLTDKVSFRDARTCIARAVAYGGGGQYVAKGKSDDGRAYYVVVNWTDSEVAHALRVVADFASSVGATADEVTTVVTRA